MTRQRRKSSLVGFALMALLIFGAGVGGARAATINVVANVTVSELWTADNEYILTQPIYVTNGATLTIEPGTVIRGEGESVAGANDPGTLIITRGSKIQSLGTYIKPVVFTNEDDDNIGSSTGTFPYDNLGNALSVTGTWGGVVVLGRAYVANDTLAGPNAAREVQIEGLTAAGGLGLYGNCAASPLFPNGCDDDDSGRISYTSIRYGGFNLSANNEINGLTLGGVGRGTQIDHVEVFQNKDDGVECFGGTVNLKNIAVGNVGDDSLDYDEGWRGKVQFYFVMQGLPGSDKSDKGGEHDGGNGPDGSQPFAIPTIYNATYIGQGAEKAYDGASSNTALVFRDNAGGRYYNSFFADFGGAAYIIEGGNTGGTATDPNTSGERAITAYTQDAFQIGPDSDFQLELQDNCFWCIGNDDVIPAPDASAFGGSSSKIHYDNGGLSNAALDNDYSDCNTALPIRGLTRAINPLPTAPDPIISIDPRPASGSSLLTTDRTPPNDGFFEPAPYKGAFSEKYNWASGWTAMSRLGYFPAKPTVTVSANITTSTLWTKDNVYELDTPIYVTNGATLTIEPGTVVRGQPESVAGANDPGTLIITRGSKIDAVGDPYYPIIFTDLNDDNFGTSTGTFPYDRLDTALSNTAQWGGVVILGRAYVANDTLAGPNAGREVQIEGLNAVGGLGLYGNCAASPLFPNDCDDDDSGRLSHVSIRYGGFNLSSNNEINGLTLGGVGRSTQIDHIEVFQNKDDGVECFGGTVNLKNVLVANVGDDSLDYDEGWRGKVQFYFVMQGLPGSDKSDKGGEHDGGNGPDGSQPFAIPTIYNATYIGQGAEKAYDGASTNTALVFRDNAGGRYYNSFFGDFGGAAYIIEGGNNGGTSTDPNTSGERSITAYTQDAFQIGPDSDFQLELQDNCWWCIGNDDVIPAPDASAFGGSSSKIHHDNGGFSNASLDNTYLDCNAPLPIRELTRTTNPIPTAPDVITAIDPRIASGSGLLSTDRTPPDDGFFMPAAYKGAFRGTNWATKWTAASRVGYFPFCRNTPNEGPAPDEVPVPSLQFRTTDRATLSWDAPQLTGLMGTQFYDVLRSNTRVDFSLLNAICLESEDNDEAAEDNDVPAPGDIYYYVVRAVNLCNDGTIGYTSNGAERTSSDCP